jgi:hypothetical protein
MIPRAWQGGSSSFVSFKLKRFSAGRIRPALVPATDEMNSMENHPLLQMEKVSKHFPGVQALEQVDFEIYP